LEVVGIARVGPFERHPYRYDQWFVKNRGMYLSELCAVGGLLPETGLGLEVGVGSGRFAWPLGIAVGIDPSGAMARMAARLGTRVCKAVAERLPFASETFDYVVMVTTVCFVDDPEESLREIHRVVKPAGLVVVGLVESESELGRRYQSLRETSTFYGEATFFTARDILDCLERTGFAQLRTRQTVFADDSHAIQPVQEGYGTGSFVAVRGVKGLSPCGPGPA
jgi:SAM-dependent methyltransferase